MKILHVIDDMSMGGANALLISLAPAQANMGHHVDILQLVDAKDHTLINKLQGTGVGIYYLAKRGTVYTPIHILRALPYLSRYDVIHVHLFPALYWIGLAKLMAYSRTPLIYTEHSTSNKRRNNPLLQAMDKFVYSMCYEKVIACSEKALETFKEVFPSISALSIPNGVDIKKNIEAKAYSKLELWGIKEDCFILTMVARFATMKRQDTIVEALRKMPTNFHAAFVGSDGGCMNRIKEMVVKYGLTDRVHFMGLRGDVPEILKTSDAIIMASDYEGLSLSSIEGMATGKPFIATSVNGLREVVEGAGILFENKDSEALITILERLFNDKDYYNNVSIACSERAKHFDIDLCAEMYIKEYQKVLHI